MVRGTSLKLSEIKRDWHLIDAKGKILGRLATQIATLLQGKNKPYYVPYLDCGDYVVVINAAKVEVSGDKKESKIYYSHSGYPGGLKKITFEQLQSKKPEEIIRKAVWGMIPKTKLGRKMIKKLYVFANSNHPYHDKFKN
ncbi:MAG: 50S ribosomal protein L13 [Nitrososphaerota archaeon]